MTIGTSPTPFFSIAVISVCSASACIETPRPQPMQNWTVFLRDDEFIAYRGSNQFSGGSEPTLPDACQWQRISRFKRFLDDELWLRSTVVIWPMEDDEPYLNDVWEWVTTGKNALVLRLPPLSPMKEQSSQLLEAYNAFSAAEAASVPECYSH